MADQYDIVIAGAGHNSLVSASYLAKAGFSVVIVEARDIVGGNTATEELNLPGYWHDSCSTAHNILQSSPTIRSDELGLAARGLQYLKADPVVHAPFADGTSITMWRDIERTCEEFARFSAADAAAYRSMMSEYDQIKGVFTQFNYTPIGWGPSLDELLAEHPRGGRWRRLVQMPAAEIILETFEDWHTQAFMLWMAFMTLQPPQRPGTGRLAYSLAYGRQTNSWIVPKGGSGVFTQLLAEVIEKHGGEIVTGQKVGGLIVENGRCVGFETSSGETYRARKAVLSTIHIKHLIDMAPADTWGEDFTFSVEAWKPGISMFVTHYATSEAPTFSTPDGPITPIAAGMPGSPDRLLRIADDFSRGRVALDDPVLLVLAPSVVDPSRAPEGGHTLKVIGFQPYELAEGTQHWDSITDEVERANLEHLRTYAPNLTDETILAATVKSPLGLERFNMHNWHGTCHGGDQDPAQMGALRPAAGWADHHTPLPGLYQTGATTHPGASVSAGPGRNAAMVMLKDLGTSLEASMAGS